MMKTRKKRKSRASQKKKRKKKKRKRKARPNRFSGAPAIVRFHLPRQGPRADGHLGGDRRTVQSDVLRSLAQDGGIVEQRLGFHADCCRGTGNSRCSACQS